MSVETSRHNRILVVKMLRPEKRNALNRAMTAGIDAAMNELEDNPELWCGILTGTESMFSAGADLAEGPGEPTERGGIAGLVTRKRTKPLVAAVEGIALGGGLELVLCCDMVVASSTAVFGFPEVKRGLMADFGGAFRMSRFVPTNIAPLNFSIISAPGSPRSQKAATRPSRGMSSRENIGTTTRFTANPIHATWWNQEPSMGMVTRKQTMLEAVTNHR